ncbi:MAG: metal ABC transporter permease [Chlamydiales bacterium]
MTDLLQIAVLSAIAIACGLLGPFLVLKRMTLFANALSHTLLLGVALAFLITGSSLFHLPNLLIGALLAALMTALFTGGLTRIFRLQEDASIGLVFTALFALGIVVVTLYTRDAHLGIEAVMGNADVLQGSDLKLALGLAGLNLAAVLLFFRQLQLTSFDPNLAKTMGIRSGFFHFLLLFLAAATCIGAFRAVGVLLVLAFLVGPFLIARLFCDRLPKLLVWSPLIGVGASAAGVGISRICLDLFGWALSTGGIVTSLIGVGYVAALLYSRIIHKLHPCAKKFPS